MTAITNRRGARRSARLAMEMNIDLNSTFSISRAVVRVLAKRLRLPRAVGQFLKVLMLGAIFIGANAWADPCEVLMQSLQAEAAQDEAAFDAEFARCIANFPDQYVCGHMVSPYTAVFQDSSGWITWTYCDPQSQGGACGTGKTDPQTCSACPADASWDAASQVCRPTANTNQGGKEPSGCGAGDPVGKPIYPLTGAEEETVESGMRIGASQLSFTYSSVAYPQPPLGSAMTPAVDVPGLGVHWHGSLFRRLVVQGNRLAAKSLRGDGHVVNFTGDGNGAFVAEGDGTDRLVSTQSGYQVQSGGDDSIETYDAAGRLAGIAYVNGAALAFSYSDASTSSALAPAPGYLLFVDDSFGRRMQFKYTLAAGGDPAVDGRLNQVIGTSGDVLGVSFDANGMLSMFTWPDNATYRPIYDLTANPAMLTGMRDENGARYFTIGYDAQSRAVSSALAGGVDAYSIQYAVAPQSNFVQTLDSSQGIFRSYDSLTAPVGTTITYPNAQTVAVDAVSVLGYPRVSGRSQPAGSGCSAATTAIAYDANGNPTSRDDFNGNRVCSAYDSSRNLATIVLEGLPGGSAGKACPTDLASYVPSPVDAAHPERKVTTAWHPDRRLKAREAEAGKITTWVYNGQPDPIGGGTANCAPTAPMLPDGKPIAVLCARYQQATTDATGALGLAATVTGATRKWSFTYNQFGQLLTETAPRLSSTDKLSHTTTYTYYADTSITSNAGHTIGDLHTVTNPRKQVTTFTSYDGAGRLLSSADANAAVTTRTYWPRGWIRTQTLTSASGADVAQTTSYDYWPTGLVKTVTKADGSTQSYSYDDAHRLTDIVDAAGNRLHYVLDNAGNRTSEQVIDASGNLVSVASRVFDALDRVQSQTGPLR